MPVLCSSCQRQNRDGARFCDGCGTALGAADTSQAQVQRSVELRHGTFMFCDLVQSTRLANRLDLDNLRLVFRAFREAVADVTRRHGGFLTRFVGDGAFMSFGYPEAREDAAESAVLAGLDLVKALRAATPVAGVSLDVRVGIASGTVVMGDLIDESAVHEEAVVGSVPHLAARLVAEAPAGGVLVADSTRKVAGRFFDYRDLGLLSLKGFDEGVRAWLVLGESAIASRFEARREAEALVEPIGRDEPLQRLAASWQGALQGRGAAVLVAGEAGIGKSRLARAARARAVSDGAAALDIDCTPRTSNTPLYPVSVLLRRIAGIDAHQSAALAAQCARDSVTRLLGATRVEEAMQYLAPVYGVPGAAAGPAESPDRVRERTIGILVEMVQALAARQPLFILCEDVHWADPTTLLLIEQAARDTAALKVLMVVSTRPAPDVPALSLNGADRIELAPLDDAASAAVIRRIARDEPIVAGVVDRIIRRGEGNPLFLEELTRNIVESGSHLDAGAATSADVPLSLQALVQARLDRWAAIKPVVQAASVLGREFSLALLDTLLQERTDLAEAVARLVDHELLVPSADRATSRFRFRHALIHDAVYRTMLRSDRERLHSRTAEILVQHFDGHPESAPDVLAHHLAASHRYAEAVACLTEASAATAARAAYLESIGHARAGLALIEQIEDARARRPWQRQLLTQLGVALAATSGYAQPEVEQTYRQARALCHDDDDPAALFSIVRGLGTFYFVRADLASADEVSTQCIRLADQARRPDLMIEALSFRGYTNVYLGRLAEGRAALQQCVSLYREHHGERFQYPSAQDAGTAAWSLLGMAAWLQGDTQECERAVGEAIAHAERLDRPFDRAYVHVWIAMLRNMQRRFGEAARHASACTEICTLHGFNTWLVAATMHGCIAAAACAPSPDSVALLRQAHGAFTAAGAEANAPFFLWGAALGLRLTGQLDDARATVAEARRRAAATGEVYLTSELLMLEAELEGDPQRARALLLEAVALADAQGAVVLSLRAALALLGPEAPQDVVDESLRVARQALDGAADYPPAADWALSALTQARRALAAVA